MLWNGARQALEVMFTTTFRQPTPANLRRKQLFSTATVNTFVPNSIAFRSTFPIVPTLWMMKASPNCPSGVLLIDLSSISFSTSFDAVARSTELVTTVTCGFTDSISERVCSKPDAERASSTTMEPGLNLRALQMIVLHELYNLRLRKGLLGADESKQLDVRDGFLQY
uniref:Uncharacterized protein n=1 Tax=Anopheles atroparvus TaxID=41427 RepID=A0A182ISY4_ANOAO